MLPTLSFVQEINIAMPDLLKATPNPEHQADANRRNQAIEQEIQILQRPKPTVQETQPLPLLLPLPLPLPTPPQTPDTEKQLFHPPGEGNPGPQVQRPWTLKDIRRHTEHIDRQDNLRKMEYELQGRLFATPITTKIARKRPRNLPLVDIYCIGAVGFYRILTKSKTTPFITSLYEID